MEKAKTEARVVDQVNPNRTLVWQRLSLPVILALGLLLRLYHIGQPSFWFDETYAAVAVESPTIPGMLSVSAHHILALPLDYLVAWVFARFSHTEGFLRLPSAIWGSLSLLVAFALFNRLAGRRVALLAVLLLALSPFHVRYSQELRFYASLVFFYLLATLFLLRVMQTPTWKNWLLFTLVTVIGLYFHVYVLLVLVTGAAWILLTPGTPAHNRQLWTPFLASSIFLVIAFAVGFSLFTDGKFFGAPLLWAEKSLFEGIGRGLGWVPLVPDAWRVGSLGTGMVLLLEIVAGITLARSRPRSYPLVLFLSMAVQVAMIVLANLFGNYFLTPRQFILLLPFTYFFASIGFFTVLDWLRVKTGQMDTRRWGPRRFLWKASAALLLLIITLPSIPTLMEYYRSDRGGARQISQVILANWEAGACLWVDSPLEWFNYRYYLPKLGGPPEIPSTIDVLDWENLDVLQRSPGQVFLVLNEPLSTKQEHSLLSIGFDPDSFPPYNDRLWFRDN